MKNFKKLFLLLAIGTIGLSSCSKNATDSNGNPTNPTLSVTPSSDVSIAVGMPAIYTITAVSNTTSNSNLVDLKISVATTGGASVGSTWDSTMSTTSISGKVYAFIVPLSATNGQIYTITMTLTDKNGNMATATRNVTAIAPVINTYTTQVLGAQMNSTGSFYASASGSVYTSAQAKASQGNVDWVYYYDVANSYPVIAAPGDATAQTAVPSYFTGWTTFNNTMMVTTTSSFSSINTAADLATAYTNASGTPSTAIPNIGVNSVVLFKTAAGKYGVFTVTALTPGNISSGSITLSVKVQQ